MIWMTREEFFDAGTVLVQFRLESVAQGRQSGSQLTLGGDPRGGGFPVPSLLEGRQVIGGRLRTPQPMGVEELLPLATAGLDEEFGRWKGEEEVPRRSPRPIVKGFEGRGIVFLEGGDELVNQERALLDEDHLITAAQAQFEPQWILRGERHPGVAVQAEAFGQRPGVEAVLLGATGGLAVPQTGRSNGLDRVEADLSACTSWSTANPRLVSRAMPSLPP